MDAFQIRSCFRIAHDGLERAADAFSAGDSLDAAYAMRQLLVADAEICRLRAHVRDRLPRPPLDPA